MENLQVAVIGSNNVIHVRGIETTLRVQGSGNKIEGLAEVHVTIYSDDQVTSKKVQMELHKLHDEEGNVVQGAPGIDQISTMFEVWPPTQQQVRGSPFAALRNQMNNCVQNVRQSLVGVGSPVSTGSSGSNAAPGPSSSVQHAGCKRTHCDGDNNDAPSKRLQLSDVVTLEDAKNALDVATRAMQTVVAFAEFNADIAQNIAELSSECLDVVERSAAAVQKALDDRKVDDEDDSDDGDDNDDNGSED